MATKIFQVTTLIEECDGNNAYAEPFLNEQDAEDYFDNEVAYLKKEYEVDDDDVHITYVDENNKTCNMYAQDWYITIQFQTFTK